MTTFVVGFNRRASSSQKNIFHFGVLQLFFLSSCGCCPSPIAIMSNNINGGGRRNALSSVDFYRRVPKDLTEVRYGF